MSKGEGDKRKVTTDALETLGTIIGPNEKRDAIHLAVENVVAKEWLYPGDHVTADGRLGIKDGGAVGIVDPFLKKSVKIGEHFWLVVYPRQIHSLRHVWTHPAFPDVPEVAELTRESVADRRVAADNRFLAEKWLRTFVAGHDLPSYEMVIAAALGQTLGSGSEDWDISYQRGDGSIIFIGTNAHCDIPPEFWRNLEIVAGRTIPSAERADYFGCSC
jgi:hypothetical protein